MEYFFQETMSKGQNGKIDWFYMKSPDDRPGI